jgi:hypothetical protein
MLVKSTPGLHSHVKPVQNHWYTLEKSHFYISLATGRPNQINQISFRKPKLSFVIWKADFYSDLSKIFCSFRLFSYYSQTCVQRPPSGPQNSGRYWQMAVILKSFIFLLYLYYLCKSSIWGLKMGCVTDRWSLFGGGR